ncbi:TonB-dependent siderophore receptor [Methylomonas sp. ZR1]|uniref:TonB-dependent siderophore receptor n=1 Tax=Methylomonas sp. ZR1 TaxID=1797072 RepID=UPI001491FCA1|nr:TonB-dependent receptor [Methylomonas sp. ZR1]NOV30269.1 TonB-dependent receptor [Methylomonas sp. ZR1]
MKDCGSQFGVGWSIGLVFVFSVLRQPLTLAAEPGADFEADSQAGRTFSTDLKAADDAVIDTRLSEQADEAARDVADMDLLELVNVKVSPFDVSSQLDSGYLASNSVSGSRFDAPISDLPFALQAFTESFIKDQKPRDIFDIARYSPGVTYRSNDFNEGNANLAIRGFAVGSLAGGNIHTLRDGVHGPSILDFTNISRLEVVKGPASFLYGQVAPGGIVNVITKNPQRRFAAAADGRYGSYGEYRFDVDVTGPATKNLFYRLAASYDQDMHYWEPYDAHSWNISPSLLWQPSDRLSVSVKYENFEKIEEPQLMQKPGYNTQAGVLPTAADPNLSGVDVPGLPDNWNSMAYSDYRRSHTHNLSTWIDFKADEHWNLRTGYSHLEYDVDALFTGNLGMSNNTTLMQGRRVRQQAYSNRDDTIELQGVGKYDLGFASLRLLLGGQYIDRNFHRAAGQAPNDPALGSNPTASPLPLWDLGNPNTWNRHTAIPLSRLTTSLTDENVNAVDKSVYGSSTFGFFDDRLLLLAGWRWTSTESQYTNRLTGQAQGATASAVTPQYGLLFKLTPEWSLFASYAESFVPGTFPANNLDGSTSIPKPTEGWGYDVGIKADWFDGRLSSTLTYFEILNKNIVNDMALTNSAGGITIYGLQSGEQRSRGIEWDATAKLTDDWQLYLSYSYMDARITEFSGQDHAILAQDPGTLDAAGLANYKNVNRFHNAPLQMSAPHLANLWTRYDFSIEALRGLHLGGGVNLVFDQTLLPDSPASSRQTYALLNALIGYTWEVGGHSMSVDLMGKNLLDEQYRPSQSSRSRPRELMINFSVKF